MSDFRSRASAERMGEIYSELIDGAPYTLTALGVKLHFVRRQLAIFSDRESPIAGPRFRCAPA